MLLSRLAVVLLVLPVAVPLSLTPVQAASFDCSKAATPFEHAICDMPELSAADDLLAKSFATASGGLTREGLTALRADQKNWLTYAQRACTDDAKPLTTGRYDEDSSACLVEKFSARSDALEQSRMISRHRFYVQGIYGAEPDPNEVDNPDSYWKVGAHELVYPVLDADSPLADAFNDYVSARVDGLAQIVVDPDRGDEFDPTIDSDVTVKVDEIAGANRITLLATSYWYGHGAAHGNSIIRRLNYYVPEDREIVAEDIFAGEDWASTLVDVAWAQLQAQHKDWLQVESAGDIAEAVVDPTRWDLSNDYGLVIQFQPYEVAAYAYGAPTITVPWDQLAEIQADTQESIRFGY